MGTLMTRSKLLAGLCAGLLFMAQVAAQGRPDSAALLAAQREAMKSLPAMNGVWRGTATLVEPNGEKRTITQTERIGPLLDGTLKVIEGRGYDAEGNLAFNSFGIVSYNPATRSYSMRSYARGLVGDFVFRPTADGFSWEIPAGSATIRYTATIRGDVFNEIGDRIVPGSEPARFFEMTLKRIGDTDWPAAGAVGPK
jgi:hypothetical protein